MSLKILRNKIINKILYKILSIFILDKKKRKILKQKMFKDRVSVLMKGLLHEYRDYWIFSLFFPWGDLGIACALIKEYKAKYGGKVLVLVNDKIRAQVVKLFPAIDEVLVLNEDLYDYIFRNSKFEIKKGEYFEINHWKFHNAPKYQSEHFLELYARMMNLDNWRNLDKPVFSEEIKESVSNEINKLNIDIKKTIFISKDSNSFDCSAIDDIFWLNIAKEYKDQGFEIVFNSKLKSWNGYKTIFLPMAEQLYFCSLCKKVIAIRSGFNDLLAIMGLENMEIYYPESMFFNTIEPIEQLVEFKRAFKNEEDKSFNENMYRITSLKMFGIGVEERLC